MRVGLTGGMGCGKSTALNLFAQYGIRIIDCDRIVYHLLESDAEIHKALHAYFGKCIIDESGRVDKKYLASMVFSDPRKRLWLEDLLHPRVRFTWESQIKKAPESVWMVEIPVLFEKNLEKLFHLTVCVSASSSTQIARGIAKGFSEMEMKARISHQLPLKEKIDRADCVITNNGSMEFLTQQVFLLSRYLSSLSS